MSATRPLLADDTTSNLAGGPHVVEDAESPRQNIALAWVQKRRKGSYESMRHALGIICLLTTVFLWTASNFLQSVGIEIETARYTC